MLKIGVIADDFTGATDIASSGRKRDADSADQ